MKNTQKNTSFVGSKTLVEIAKEKLQKKELEMFESEYLPIQEAFKDIPLHLVEKFLIQNIH